MSDKASHKRSGLGGNPLSQSLFSPTVNNSEPKEVSTPQVEQETKPLPTSEKKKTTFLHNIENADKEAIGLQVTTDINDWLDKLVKSSRRKHGRKVPKQVWIQAGVELLRALPVDWSRVEDIDDLRKKLEEVVALYDQHSGRP